MRKSQKKKKYGTGESETPEPVGVEGEQAGHPRPSACYRKALERVGDQALSKDTETGIQVPRIVGEPHSVGDQAEAELDSTGRIRSVGTPENIVDESERSKELTDLNRMEEEARRLGGIPRRDSLKRTPPNYGKKKSITDAEESFSTPLASTPHRSYSAPAEPSTPDLDVLGSLVKGSDAKWEHTLTRNTEDVGTQPTSISISDSSPEELRNHKRRKIHDPEERRPRTSDLYRGKDMAATIKKMEASILNLYGLMRVHTNTKVEIKDGIRHLKRLADELATIKGQQWLRNMAEEDGAWEDIPQNTMVEQTKVIKSLPHPVDFDTWTSIKGRKWAKEAFVNTEVKVGNPLDTKDSVVKLVIVEPHDRGMDNSIQRLYRDRYPDLDPTREEMEVLEHLSTVRIGTSTEDKFRKIVKINIDGTEPDLWNKLTEVKKEAATADWIALHHLEAFRTDILQKMAESIFSGSDTKVVIHTTDRRNRETVAPKRGKEKPKSTYAFIVDGGGQNFKEALGNVKESLRTCGNGLRIRNLRSTRDGKVMIITDRDAETAENIRKAVGSCRSDIKVRKVGEIKINDTVYIRGMDALTKKAEVTEALTNEGIPTSEYILGDLRPARNDTRSITIRVTRESAERLVQLKFIKVGMVRCVVVEHVNVLRCFRCWELGHRAIDCNGPNRRENCLKCGEAGHSVKGCTREEFCPSCGEAGHRVGTSRCSLFRRALSTARKEARKERPVKPVTLREKAIVEPSTLTRSTEDGNNADKYTNDECRSGDASEPTPEGSENNSKASSDVSTE